MVRECDRHPGEVSTDINTNGDEYKRDITILTNEEEIKERQQGNPEEEGVEEATVYQYTGNQFRTVYDLTEEDILTDKEKYLNYTTEAEPTLEQLRHDNEIIDSYTLELLEGGVL